MYPLFFPPQAANTPYAIPAPTCFRKEVDYDDACARYGVDVFRRPLGPCSYCGGGGGGGQWGGSCDCDASSEVTLQPGDIELIAFQIQLYELGLDADWIKKEVAFRGMESRERLRYEFDGTEKFFIDGVPSSRVLPTGPTVGIIPKLPPAATTTTPQRSPPQQYVTPHRPPLARRESRLRYMETYEASEQATVKKAAQGESKEEVLMMLGKMRLGDAEKDVGAQVDTQPVSTKRTNRRRRGRNRAAYS